LSELDDAVAERMAFIVLSEHRPFTCSDFRRFSVRDKEYHMAYGTFRNKISKLIKKGEVEVDFCSSCTFYTLKGHKFGKLMTHNHTGALSRKSNAMYELVNNIPLGKNSLHDIRLCFKQPNLWSILSTNSSFRPNSQNKDIRLPGINVEDLFIGIKVHKSDTVSVSIACSFAPIAIDIFGVIRLSNSLTRVEERLMRYIDESGVLHPTKCTLLPIPDHMKWIVKMWHFGADSTIEYYGEKYEITYADAEGILVRIYSKQMKNRKTQHRLEIQEYPNKELDKAIQEKLDANHYNHDHGTPHGPHGVSVLKVNSKYGIVSN